MCGFGDTEFGGRGDCRNSEGFALAVCCLVVRILKIMCVD